MEKKTHVALFARAALAFACLVVLAGAVSGQTIPDFLQGMSQNAAFTSASCAPVQGPNWLVLVGLTLTISIFMVGLAFMFGMGFGLPKVTAWGKENLFQVFASAVIVLGFFTGGMIADGLFSSFVGRPNVTLIDNAIDYATVVTQTVGANFIVLNVMNIAVGVYGNLQIYLRAGGFGLSFSLAPMFRPILDALGTLVNFMMAAVWEWAAQLFMLCFIKQQMLTILLPVGVMLRTFPFSRSAGGALIAICIGLYFVYPAMLTVDQRIVTAHYGGMVHDDPSSSSCDFTSINSCIYNTGMKETIKTVLEGFGLTVAGGVTAIFLQIFASGLMALSAPIFSSVILLTLAIAVYEFIFQLVYLLIIVSVLLTLLNVFVTMTSIREIAKFLGSDLNLSALLRLI